MSPHARLIRIDIMVGLAMVMVVLGHQSFSFSPSWYAHGLHEWIYRFHMEVFVFLSAFLIRYSYREVKSVRDYVAYEGRKLKKFFVPFVVVGMVVAAVQAWNEGLAGEEFWRRMWEQVRWLFLYPMQSDASFLWYIYVLFGFYLISPLVFLLPRWLKMALCLLSIGLPLVGCGYMFAGALFCRYAFFYFLGVLCAEGLDELRGVRTWVLGLLSLPFVVWSVRYLAACIHPEMGWTFVEDGPAGFDILTGCMALPCFYLLARLVEHCRWLSAVLARVSRDCFWIYLLQMFVAWGCAYVFDALGLVSGVPFWVFLVVSSVLSIAVPVGARRLAELLPVGKGKKKSK